MIVSEDNETKESVRVEKVTGKRLGRAAISSHGSQKKKKKGRPGERFSGEAQIKLLLPTISLAASVFGTLRILEEVKGHT